ncbi:MAG: MFS transporter [Armatimonadetes bacterium]|nr:MFS transporter [Akkermansiaceae bacterium]
MSEGFDASGNPKKYIWFTTLYNARAYYPILAILFLDLGLTLDQYVMLNLVWAATIFIFEVPSGALADVVGRRTLLVAASGLMVVEMGCLLFAPVDGGWILFSMCVANRFFSGLSEATASGADEALAYDSLPEKDRDAAWDGVLGSAMRYRSVGFVIAMIIGGMLYDPSMLNRALPDGMKLSEGLAHRLPVALVFLQGLVCLGITLRMVEPVKVRNESVSQSCRKAVALTLKTAKWVFTNPKTLSIVMVGLAIDSVVRNFATITSSYYRLIELPEWTFGFLGAAVGILGFAVPSIATRLNKRFSPLTNLGLIAGVVVLCLSGLVPANSYWCLIPGFMIMMTMGLMGFTISKALHRESDSLQRATVLSVKGLVFNLAYGAFSLGFSRLLTTFPDEPAGNALRQALLWQVPFFALLVSVLIFWAKWMLADKDRRTSAG